MEGGLSLSVLAGKKIKYHCVLKIPLISTAMQQDSTSDKPSLLPDRDRKINVEQEVRSILVVRAGLVLR